MALFKNPNYVRPVANTFSDAVSNQETRTENNMKTRKSSANACVDLFYKIGASRGKNIISDFTAAFAENPEVALRVAQWARDVRGGAGERQLFKDILGYMEKYDPELAIKLIQKIPEIGRWDDMLINYTNKKVESFAYSFYGSAISEGNGLAAKWAPRKGMTAVKLRTAWGLKPAAYRKLLVSLTDVVESAMCENRWEEIPFGNVPSLAASRYKKAFYKRAPEAFQAYIDSLVKGEAKVNASAVYPYDILKGLRNSLNGGWGSSRGSFRPTVSNAELQHMIAQWDALPNYLEEASVLPMVDTSGSMWSPVGNNNNLMAIDVAVSLGLYCAEKNTGKFADLFLTFSGTPTLENLKGNVVQKYGQMGTALWGMNTNLHAAFDLILQTAVKGKVPQSEMPGSLLIFSDMQFDGCTRFDDSAMEMVKRKYASVGYEAPKVIFWNLRNSHGVPVSYTESGTALVSGFSPSLMKTVLSSTALTPEKAMLDAVMIDRYKI